MIKERRIFFATDVHGSEICWKKFLAAASYYDAGILILGGDMTGKALVPIVKRARGGWEAVLLQERHLLETEAEVLSMEKAIGSRGYYPFRTDDSEMESFAADPAKIDALFRKTVLSVVARWMELADGGLAKEGIDCFVCPGNDDAFEIDAIIGSSKTVRNAEGQIIELVDGFRMASTGWCNPTPWRTHREEEDDRLYSRISSILKGEEDFSRFLFCFHAPPRATGLDDAPELDDKLNVLNAGQSSVSVGSEAVRRVIEERRPLLSLHGHIHESKGVARIGKTLCLNPGSLYEQGVLQGALIDLDPKNGIRSWVLTTG
ncbi:MAG: hypothetical protein ABSF43_05070 [Rectinemataceae bacterium]